MDELGNYFGGSMNGFATFFFLTTACSSQTKVKPRHPPGPVVEMQSLIHGYQEIPKFAISK